MTHDSDVNSAGPAASGVLADAVFEVMRQAVIKGLFPHGSRLVEAQIAEELGVSRTPVREAIRKLHALDLVVVEPNRGAVVRGLSAGEVRQINYVRKLLDGGAAELACQFITDEEIGRLERNLAAMEQEMLAQDGSKLAALNSEFHEIIRAASRNSPLLHVLKTLMDRIQLVWEMSRPDFTRYENTLTEHRAIFEALRRRDAAGAREAVANHIDSMEANLLKTWDHRDSEQIPTLRLMIDGMMTGKR